MHLFILKPNMADNCIKKEKYYSIIQLVIHIM